MTNDEITMVQGIENAPAAAKLREEVFLQEQGFSTEFDEIDPIAYGDIYLDEHCPHIHMKKQL